MSVRLMNAKAALLLLVGCTLLGCKSQSVPNAPASHDTGHLWSDAEEVWSQYVRHLQTSEGDQAAQLATKAGLRPFARYRVAALLLDREQLLRMRPEDVVLVLQLRALSTADDLLQMTPRDVFVTVANAGLLGDDLNPNVRVGRQRGTRLYLRSGKQSHPSETLLVTRNGPRVVSANAEFQKRWRFRTRMGLSLEDPLTISPDRLLSEAARELNRPAQPDWWTPLRPMAAEVRKEALAKLRQPEGAPDRQKTTQSTASATQGPPKPRLEAKIIQQTIRDQFDAMRVCYEDGLLRDEHLEGKVTIQFVIERDGRVSVEQHTSDIPIPDVMECVAVQFLTLQFPEPDGGIVQVTYPVQFSPG